MNKFTSTGTEIPQFAGYSDMDREGARARAMEYLTWFRANKRNVTKANAEFCMLDIGTDYFTRMVFLLAADGLLTGHVLRELVDRLWANVQHSGPLSLHEWARLYTIAYGPKDIFGNAWDAS